MNKRQQLEQFLREGKWTMKDIRAKFPEWKGNMIGVYLANTKGLVKEGTRHSYIYSLPAEKQAA